MPHSSRRAIVTLDRMAATHGSTVWCTNPSTSSGQGTGGPSASSVSPSRIWRSTTRQRRAPNGAANDRPSSWLATTTGTATRLVTAWKATDAATIVSVVPSWAPTCSTSGRGSSNGRPSSAAACGPSRAP